MKGAPHIKLTRRQFVRLKRAKLREAISLLHRADDSVMTGAAYLPDDVQAFVREAHKNLTLALERLNAAKC